MDSTPVAVEGNKVTFKHVRLPGELTMAADKIILAVGQHARLDAFAELEPQRNTINTQNYQTRDPQVFAAGDIVEGDKNRGLCRENRERSRRGDSSLFRGSLLMLTKDLSITFCGVKFPNPFCLSSSPVGNCYEMCAKAYDTGWGGVVFKTIGFFIANEVSPRFDHLVKEDTGFIGFKNMEQIAEHPLEENLAALRRLKEDYPDKVLIASIMGENEQQWEELARLVQEAGADMIECNFSCSANDFSCDG